MRVMSMAAAVLLTPALAAAQVNTEKLRKANREEGFSGHVDASFALRRGNVNLLRIGSGFRVQYETLHDKDGDGNRASKDLVFIVGDLTFGEKIKSGISDRFINNGFAATRWTRMWHPRVGSEVFAQAQFNEFIRLKSRGLGGLGVRAVVVESKVADVYVGSGYMLEYERLDVPAGCGDDATADCTEDANHRWTNYLAFSIKLLDGKLTLQNTAYAQPRFDRFSDYRLLSEGALTVSVNSLFSLGIALNLRYDSEPPTDDLERLDLEVKNVFKFSF